MKSLKLEVVAIFFALAGTGLYAQKVDMRATIPFDFHAGDRLMPAGEYVIHEQGPCVTFNRADAAKAIITLITNSVSGADATRDARLVFNRYGREYFLTTIWNPFSDSGRQLVLTNREKELAKLGSRPTREELTLANRK
jgi:hypothetical protein